MVSDGEAIGDNFHVFDLLENGTEDLRDKCYLERYLTLKSLSFCQSIKVVPLAVKYDAKKALYDELKANNKEGVVFKNLDAPYKSGRPSSGGDMIKFKFYETASVRVCQGRTGKHSVGMEILENKKWIPVGNVTIGTNTPLPPIGSIIEVRYLYAYKGGSLYQPSYLGIRDDIDDNECVISQLKYKAAAD